MDVAAVGNLTEVVEAARTASDAGEEVHHIAGAEEGSHFVEMVAASRDAVAAEKKGFDGCCRAKALSLEEGIAAAAVDDLVVEKGVRQVPGADLPGSDSGRHQMMDHAVGTVSAAVVAAAAGAAGTFVRAAAVAASDYVVVVVTSCFVVPVAAVAAGVGTAAVSPDLGVV